MKEFHGRVLIIEDNTPIREEIAAILDLEGFTAVEASDGSEGIATAFRELPDLIICDITMPGHDGYAVLEALHGHEKTAAIPASFLNSLSL